MDPEKIDELGGNVVVLPLDAKGSVIDLPEFLETAAGEGYTPLEAVRRFAVDSSAAAAAGDRATLDRFRFDDASGATRSRGFLKVQDGCDNSCAYCRVRLARGRSMSLPLDTILERARALEAEGFGEIVLTGVNLTAWQDGEKDLAEMLIALDQSLDYSQIRLSSMEPDMISPRLAQAAGLERIRPHYHLPVQSGSDRILSAVGRNYGAGQVLKAVFLLCEARPDPFLAADIIVGLPGETDADFDRTMNLVRECGFAHIHAFPFSPRPGTPLFDAPGKVPERIAGERLARLGELSSQLHAEFIARRLGTIEEAIIERRISADRRLVLTDRYLHISCDGIPEDASSGRLCRVRIADTPENLHAVFVEYV
jgi:threonylcarbamoyladenosine tRNA methylthiotransferase MtaB